MKVRSPYDEPVDQPWLGRVVNPGQVVDIPADLLPNFVAAGWKPADPEASKAAKELDAAASTDAPAAGATQEG